MITKYNIGDKAFRLVRQMQGYYLPFEFGPISSIRISKNGVFYTEESISDKYEYCERPLELEEEELFETEKDAIEEAAIRLDKDIKEIEKNKESILSSFNKVKDEILEKANRKNSLSDDELEEPTWFKKLSKEKKIVKLREGLYEIEANSSEDNK